jgi:hypothetical protein
LDHFEGFLSRPDSKVLCRLGLVGRLDEAGNFSVHHPPWSPVELGRHDRHGLTWVILPVLLLRIGKWGVNLTRFNEVRSDSSMLEEIDVFRTSQLDSQKFFEHRMRQNHVNLK